MSPKNKNRLYITLQHRAEQPGFHWALVLAPKSESSDSNIKDSHIFHATNTIQPGVPIGPNGKPGWRYEDKKVNPLRSGNLVARILVAKLPTTKLLVEQAQDIDAIVQGVQIIQNDENWTCRVWVEEALAALRASEGNLSGYFRSIPQVDNGSSVETRIKKFGETAKRKIKEGSTSIKHPNDLPFEDMRV